jgi:hypothetical protein
VIRQRRGREEDEGVGSVRPQPAPPQIGEGSWKAADQSATRWEAAGSSGAAGSERREVGGRGRREALGRHD